tara:strand:- start:79 stop:393 length:315 start_codon:yes stop_codon:yes gene_type:complete
MRKDTEIRWLGNIALEVKRSAAHEAELVFHGLMELNDKIFDMMEKREQAVEQLTVMLKEKTNLNEDAYRVMRLLSRIMYFDSELPFQQKRLDNMYIETISKEEE